MPQQLDAAKVKTPTQLLAAAIVLTIVVVPALITGAATVTTPPWLPVVFALAAAVYAPLPLLLLFRMLTKHRDKMLGDEAISKLNSQALEVTPRLDKSLDIAGLDLGALAAGKGFEDVATQLKEDIRGDLNLLLAILGNLEHQGVSLTSVPAPALLEAARGLMAGQQWGEAARYLDEYVKSVDDWQVHWSRGVAYGNERGGITTDLSALRAYNDAIALSPKTIDPNDFARLHSYRGAMLKRLGRLDEAEADLLLAKKLANRDFELADIAYNLSCIYAMMGRKYDALTALRSLQALDGMHMVLGHLDDYFVDLRNDPEFRQLVGLAG
ncbi:TPR end-of-group domain-containing protein [Amycolatopsis lexingtonensis]|uniref:TPR end-of-group domain-containing protein n=1 Tax=Amycolatopsis lexingtonensis TaxID=218822 RepID=UPI003F70AEDC